MTLNHWTFDPVTGIYTGWLHADGPQHIYQDNLGDRYIIKRDTWRDGSEHYNVQLVCFRSAGARVGQHDSLAEAFAAAETHADTLVPA